MKKIWMIVPVYLILLMEVVKTYIVGFSYDDFLWNEILLILYNIYFSFIFLSFLKKDYHLVSKTKKKLFKYLSYTYLLTAIVSTIIFIVYLAGVDSLKEWLIIIFLQVAPAFGLIYTMLLLPFRIMKNFKWSIFYIKK